MLAMSLKFHILEFGTITKLSDFTIFSEVIKRHVPAKGVVCGTN